jgi:hypothetical protein
MTGITSEIRAGGDERSRGWNMKDLACAIANLHMKHIISRPRIADMKRIPSWIMVWFKRDLIVQEWKENEQIT